MEIGSSIARRALPSAIPIAQLQPTSPRLAKDPDALLGCMYGQQRACFCKQRQAPWTCHTKGILRQNLARIFTPTSTHCTPFSLLLQTPP